MRGAVLSVLLLVACLVAGCSGEERPATPPPAPDAPRMSDDRTSDEAETDASSPGCIGLSAFLLLPRDEVQSQLPQGFTAAPYLVGPEAAVNIAAVTCETLEVGNVTVHDVGLAWADAYLEGWSVYRWHFVVDEDPEGAMPLTHLLQAAGWPVLPGEVELQETAFTMRAEDLEVKATVAVAMGTSPAFSTYPTGVNAVGQDAVRYAMTQSFSTGASVLAFSGATVEANRGPLLALAPSEGDPLAGIGNALNSAWSLTLVE